jgi:hypothetical protein
VFHAGPRGILTLLAIAMCWALAVAEAQQGGHASPKERALLNRLRESLGISAVVADTLERDLKAKHDGQPA